LVRPVTTVDVLLALRGLPTAATPDEYVVTV
jgi:hypothetical protein